MTARILLRQLRGTRVDGTRQIDIMFAAADEIERLRQCLQCLHDLQNGPPLPKYEEEWTVTMAIAEDLLRP